MSTVFATTLAVSERTDKRGHEMHALVKANTALMAFRFKKANQEATFLCAVVFFWHQIHNHFPDGTAGPEYMSGINRFIDGRTEDHFDQPAAVVQDKQTFCGQEKVVFVSAFGFESTLDMLQLVVRAQTTRLAQLVNVVIHSD